jgi:hypothetical protein
MRWRAFCAELLEHVEQLGVSTVVTLGALLTDTAHTRPVPVTGTAYDPQAAERYGLERSKYEGPTGIVAVAPDAPGEIPGDGAATAVPAPLTGPVPTPPPAAEPLPGAPETAMS